MTRSRLLLPAAAALSMVLGVALSAALLPAQEKRGRDRSPPIAGRVLDAAGRPSAETWVYLVRRNHPELPAGFAACLGDEPYVTEVAVTDARGRFSIDPDGYWPMAMYARSEDGATAPLRFPVQPGDFVVLELQPAAILRGVVLHAGTRDRPAQGYAVEARVSPELPRQAALWGFEVEPLLPFVRLHTRTDALGKFELTVPAASRTRIGVRSADTVLWSDDPTEITLPPAQPLALQLLSGGAPVTAARAHDLSMPALARRADERGQATVSNLGTSPILVIGERHLPVLVSPTDVAHPVSLKKGERLRGRMVRTGTPIAGARLVFARPFSRGPRELRWRFAAWTERCDDEGRFDFGWVERDVPLVGYVEVDGRFTCFLLRVPDGPLDLGDVQATTGYQLRGNVTLPDRTPAAGAWVFYRPAVADGGGGLDHPAVELSLSQAIMTGRGGRFLIEGLMPGSYRVVVRKRGNRPSEVVAVAKTEAPVTHVQLAPSPEVRGTIVDGEGRPVPGINVTLMQNAKQFAAVGRRFGDPPVHLGTRTADDGTFAFVDLPTGMAFDLRAYGNHAGRVRHAEQRDVPLDGQKLELKLR